MRTLIVGCGYVGLQLGTELARQGHEVFGLKRSADSDGQLAKAGVKPLVADITQREQLNAIPLPFDWVVNLVSSDQGGVPEYQQTYLQGTKNLIEWLPAPTRRKNSSIRAAISAFMGRLTAHKSRKPARHNRPVKPAKFSSKPNASCLMPCKPISSPRSFSRASGIYGPDRPAIFFCNISKMKPEFPAKATASSNMIHRDDLVGCIMTALKNGTSRRNLQRDRRRTGSANPFLPLALRDLGQIYAAFRPRERNARTANAPPHRSGS